MLGFLRLVSLSTTTDPSKQVSSSYRLKSSFITLSPFAATQPAIDAVQKENPLVSLTSSSKAVCLLTAKPTTKGTFTLLDVASKVQMGQKPLNCNDFVWIHLPVRSSLQEISKALQTGPLITGMTPYSDFLKYSSAIYSPTNGHRGRNRLVKLVGYGRENKVDYKICKKSWIKSGVRKSTSESGRRGTVWDWSHGVILFPLSSTSRILSKEKIILRFSWASAMQ